MQLKIMYFTVYTPSNFMTFQNLVLGNVIEHDRIFVFVYVNSLFTSVLECGLALNQGVLAQKVLKTKTCLLEAAELFNNRGVKQRSVKTIEGCSSKEI